VDTARLVARIQGGDADAFGNLYTRYFDRVYSYVRVMLRNRTDAEEVTQDIFADVFEGVDRYVPRERPFRAWLFTIARNHAINHMQRERRLELVDPQDLDRRRERPTEDEISIEALDWISDHEVRLFIERLPLAQREVLLLRYLADMTHDEIAKALDRSPVTVRMQLSRALSFLRDRLAAIGREPKRGDRIRSRLLIPQSRVLRVRRFGLTSPGPTG
jgi:RNA polymerase sigma-70 factor (ECF subfamily)